MVERPALGGGWRRSARVAVRGACLAAVIVLAGCGGDGEGASAPPPPDRVPDAQLLANQRIESLDTAQLKAVPVAREREQGSSLRLPAGTRVECITLPPLVQPKQREAVADKTAPLRIGIGRDVDAASDAQAVSQFLHWQQLADGTQVAALDFAADGARALRLGLRTQLPDGALLRFHAATGDGDVLEISAADIRRSRRLDAQSGVDAGLYWGPTVAGSQVRLEVQLPAGSDTSALLLSVPRLSHLTQTLSQVEIKAAGSCNENVSCAADWDVPSRAVARMQYTDRSGGSFYCTGTLLNDVRNSQTPYFLTAGHCALGPAEASSVETRWFYRHADCGDASPMDARDVLQLGGADWLMRDAASDSSLLRLRTVPPADVVYAGSYFGSDLLLGDSVVGVHHAAGGVQKISMGTLDGYAQCGNNNCGTADAKDGDMLQVHWQRGTTEQGSSGSALFATLEGRPYVVGTLHAGRASCNRPDGADYYGRFDRAFAAGMRDWLAAQ